MTTAHERPSSGHVDEQLDLSLVFSLLWRGRLLIIGATVVMAGVLAATALWMTPIYRASIVIVPASTGRIGGANAMSGSLASLASLAGVDVGAASGAQVQEALAVLRSREFNEAFITEHNLRRRFYWRKWDSGRQMWKVPAERQPTLYQAYEYFSELRAIEENKRTGLVTIQIEWCDPEEAALWANALVDRLNEIMRIRALERTNAYLSHLQEELQNTVAVDTRAAINRLVETQINERMLANVTKEYAFRVVDRALVPDSKAPARPNKLILTTFGATLGLLGGSAFVLLRVKRRSRQRNQ